MSILSGLMGNASEIEVDAIEAEFNKFMIAGEYIEKAFKVYRDVMIFTNRRLILADKQGLSGKKLDLHSLPYRSITQYATESTGRFDADAVLKVWILGQSDPFIFEFKRGSKLPDVQLILAEHVLSFT
ncbi:PH domain-containing protein [bacterium]|nr:PH domain-containing protein [bacterium]